MQGSMWRTVLLQGVGLLFYLAGMLLFLVIAIDVYLSEPAHSLENFETVHGAYMLVSLVLIIAGGAVMQKFGGAMTGMGGWLNGTGMMWGGGQVRQEPRQSALEQLGYTLPPEDEETAIEDMPVDDGMVRCPECGETEEAGYRYCAHCSARLPD